MSQNDDISANNIPDILAGTQYTEQRAIENDHDAVMAALREDPNLLAEVLEPGFVEVVNELAGDAPPTLGNVETVGQAYQDANHQTMGEAYQDLLAQHPADPGAGSDPVAGSDPQSMSPLEELHQIEQQIEELEAHLNPTQEFSSFEDQGHTLETMQAEPDYTIDQGPGGVFEG
ncbi:MAG: hypothetical protein JO246_12950 [Frankiaceae bacterium]|nr:hypothetical protein [Frankiaceae bacterium]MBV9872837.1 hypothetical protein [Frankiaceae bacterium]